MTDDWELRRLDATIQAAALCAYSDGHLAMEERERLCECIATHAATEQEARSLIALARDLPEWAGQTEKGFREHQMSQIKQGLRTLEEREFAFSLAVEVAYAHEGIGIGETSFLLNLFADLGIEPTRASELLRKAKHSRK